MTLPFIDMPRDPHKSLTDIELMIPHCVALLQIPGTLRVVLETPIPRHIETEKCLEMTKKMIVDLDAWAEEYPDMAKVATNAPSPSETDTSLASGDSKNREGSDTFVPLKSNYLATRVTLNMLVHKIYTESQSSPDASKSLSLQYLEDAVDASNAIVKAGLEVEQASAPSFDVGRTIAPLLTVVCAGPTTELRNTAWEIMERWGSRISGLPSIMTTI
jgi:hypothetical protein